MKKIIFSIVAAVSINAAAASQYITVEVCSMDHPAICNQVTYKVRQPSPEVPAVITCAIGDGGAEGPCPTGKVPNWLKKLNQLFPNATPVDSDLYKGQ
jgi:hypothetical protein